MLTGSCKCLAMVAGNLNPNGAARLKVLLDYALPGHNILVEQYNGGTLNTSNTYNGSAYLSQIVARFPGPAVTFPNHVAAVRKALATARFGSVTYVMTGFGSVLADVLASPADTISPLSGAALVKDKVGIVYWASGIFPSNTGTPEPNILADIGAARAVVSGLAALGVPIVFAGDEVAGIAISGAGRIADAPPAGTSPTTSPFEYAFELFGYNAATPRNAWGSVAVWSAIYGAAPLFQLGGSNGTVTINTDGTNAWAATPAAGQSYLARLATPDVASAAFNSAIAISSGNLTVAGATWGQGAGLPVIAAAVTTSTPTAPAIVLPLDAVSVPALAAWGLRKLRAAYAGAAAHIPNGSGADIGFSGYDFAGAAAVSATAGGNAFVTTLYDQTGNGYSVAQAAANNAQIVASGTLSTAGASNRAAMTMIDSVANGLRNSSFPLTGTACTISVVAAQANTLQYKNLVGYRASGQAHHYDNAASASLLLSNAGANSIGAGRNGALEWVTDTANTLFCATVVFDGTNVTVYRDNVVGTPTASTGTFGPSGTLDIGWVLDGVNSADAWAGPVMEVLIFPSALGASDLAALMANQKAYYGTP